MTEDVDVRALLHRVADEAGDWFDALGERPVGPSRAAGAVTVADVLRDGPLRVDDVVADLAREASPGLTAMGSPRWPPSTPTGRAGRARPRGAG